MEKSANPCNPKFYYIKVGCKGVYITQTCKHDIDVLYECFDCLTPWRPLMPLLSEKKTFIGVKALPNM